MKKGYYIHFGGGKTSGIAKKIEMQMTELGKYTEISEVLVEDTPRNLFQRLVGLLPTMSIERSYEKALEKIKDPDFLYIRRAVADKKYVFFLKEIKKRYPRCKVIVEIFTYPYNRDDFGKWNTWPFYFKELLYKGQLKDAVDRFVTYSQDESIFGIPCIRTMNGVDIERIQPVKSGNKDDSDIQLVAVANFQRHHGYERILKGLSQYRGKKRVVFHLVGEGTELKKYRSLVRKWGLEKSVIFYGKKTGRELEDIYEKADILVGSFGMYKLGIESISTLKTSEYLAKGLPILTGCKERALTEADPAFYKEFPSNRNAVDIEEVVKFFDEIAIRDVNLFHAEIRRYAEATVAMTQVLRPVVKYICVEENVKNG